MCEIDKCENGVFGRGLCSKHYDRWYRNGNPLKTLRCPPNLSIEEKLQWHGWTVMPSGCWEFDGRKNGDGYGVVKHEGRYEGAHRWAYRAWVGTLNPGEVVRHKCDNPPCINPADLLKGTQADNIADTVSRGRQRAPRKLSWDQVEEIRRLYLTGEYKQSTLESQYGLGSGTVSRIMSGKIYANQY